MSAFSPAPPPWFALASRPARPDICTSAAHAPRCSRWAYARKHGGKFILRIEDTDRERSTEASTQAILDAMEWLQLGYDEGPFYQMQRLERYREIADRLIAQGHAYHCYASKEELDAMREEQRERGDKPRYDGRWRPENAKRRKRHRPASRRSSASGIRTTAKSFSTIWSRARSSLQNEELDDLVILRADGVPTYNFGVVVDDIDMNITHVIRGDDHVNNTPRQINIFRALGCSASAVRARADDSRARTASACRSGTAR